MNRDFRVRLVKKSPIDTGEGDNKTSIIVDQRKEKVYQLRKTDSSVCLYPLQAAIVLKGHGVENKEEHEFNR